MPVIIAAATREYIEAGKDLQGKGFDPRKLLAPGADAIKATVKEKWNYLVLLIKLNKDKFLIEGDGSYFRHLLYFPCILKKLEYLRREYFARNE